MCSNFWPLFAHPPVWVTCLKSFALQLFLWGWTELVLRSSLEDIDQDAFADIYHHTDVFFNKHSCFISSHQSCDATVFKYVEAVVWIDGNIIFAGLLSLNRHEADYLYHVKSIVIPPPLPSPRWAGVIMLAESRLIGEFYWMYSFIHMLDWIWELCYTNSS